MYRFHRYNLIRWDISSPSVAYKLFVRGLYDYVIVKEETSSSVTTRSYFVAAKGVETSWSNRASLTYSNDIQGRKLVNEGQNWLLANTGGEVFSGLLDEYGGAAAAYSLRKLSSTYSGDAIVVRRSSDNATQSIGFVNNELDTSSLNSFCSGTDGFITTWYDQSGNSYDTINTTASSQPKIYDSVSGIKLLNGKPYVEFEKSRATFLQTNNTWWTYTGDSTVFHISRNRNTEASQYGSVISQHDGSLKSLGIQWQQFPGSATRASTDIFAPGGVSTVNTQSVNTQYLAYFKWNNWSTHKTNGNTQIAINGNLQSLAPYGSDPTTLGGTNVRIGTSNNAVNGSFQGDIQEIIVYIDDQSINRTGIETNINEFYSIY